MWWRTFTRAEPRDMWEWRTFTRAELPGPDHLQGAREDVYWPACAGLGLKLRDGDESTLEVKVRSELSARAPCPAAPSAGTNACCVRCPRTKGGAPARAPRRARSRASSRRSTRRGSRSERSAARCRRAACTAASGGGARPPASRWTASSWRTWTPTARRRRRALIERWRSTSVETGGELAELAAAVRAAGATPGADAEIVGYPGLVVEIALRALAARRPDGAVALEPAGKSDETAAKLEDKAWTQGCTGFTSTRAATRAELCACLCRQNGRGATRHRGCVTMSTAKLGRAR